MLEYLYTFDFEHTKIDNPYDTTQKIILQEALEVVAVYILADKYDVPGLRRCCRQALKDVAACWLWKLEGGYRPFTRFYLFILTPQAK